MTDPTDAELITRYRARLLDEEAALATASEETREARKPVELDQQSVGRLSRQDALQQQAMAQAQKRRRAAERTRITAALKRLEEGEWGFCVKCGEEIAEARLRHDPSIALCVNCAA